MSIGSLARKILGKKLFPLVGRFYRSIFVDLEKVAQLMSKEIPENANVLDVGGGDGELLNHLLANRSDIKVTMIDLREDIGNAIHNDFRGRVCLLPETSMRRFLETNEEKRDAIIVSDVIHHIPPMDRLSFLQDLKEFLDQSQATLLIKDVEPGYFISGLGYLSDRHITGDKNVSLISKNELQSLIEAAFGRIVINETSLFFEDKPNYLLSIRHPRAAMN